MPGPKPHIARAGNPRFPPISARRCREARRPSVSGDYHYLAGALLHTARTGIPLLNDMPGLPVPLTSDGAFGDRAKQLSAMLVIDCVRLALPELPLLRPEDLMEFRADTNATLRGFRRSMLRYAGDLNGKVASVTPAEIQAATKFFVDTEIISGTSVTAREDRLGRDHGRRS